VVDQFGVAAAGATVTGSWTAKGTATCVTDVTGWCTLSQNYPSSRATTTFTVTNVSRSGATYNPAANTDPDGDSTGTAIVINRP
jgi:hypothetical protein